MTKPSKSSERARKHAEIIAVNQRLQELFEQDVATAVENARRLLNSEDLDQENRELIAAGILVDGGSHLKDPEAVSEGVAIFRRLREQFPDEPAIAYNLANGLNVQTGLSTSEVWEGELTTTRREARALYYWSATTTDDCSQASKALTNQANLLRMSFRWIEAYDAYAAALHADPGNGVAASGIARLIDDCVERHLLRASLRRVAAQYLERAMSSEPTILKYAGRPALENIRQLASANSHDPGVERPHPSGYAGFVSRHRLALSLSMEEFHSTHRFWDTLSIRSITEPISAGAEVPPAFAMWNCLKSDFIAARWLAYRAVTSPRDTADYQDTLDYANYGIGQSLQILAQRAALDILDKVAACVTEYLQLPGDPRKVHFWSRFHETKDRQLKSPRKWQAEVLAEIQAGNPGLLALAELADDLISGGFLNSKRTLRHSSTHRFVVLHDEGCKGSRPSAFIEHFKQVDFERATIETLQVSRAALHYLIDVVRWRERRLRAERGDRPVGQLTIPPHHWIRGR